MINCYAYAAIARVTPGQAKVYVAFVEPLIAILLGIMIKLLLP